MSLDRLLDPDSIAVIGSSQDAGKIGHAAMSNAELFTGNVYPVNPNADEVFGRQCYDTIEEIDDDVDLALLCVPREITPTVVDQCGRADVGGVVSYAAGFSEASAEGADIEAEITATAREYGLTVLGPNTSGFINPERGVYASFVSDVSDVEAGPVSVVAQSGGVNHILLFIAAHGTTGISKAIGLGNAAETGFSEIIMALDADTSTESIVLHVEGTDDARGLLKTCRSVETPVTMYKVGQDDVGGFAASHTGSMIGEYQLYEAGCAQYGVPMVQSCQELIDVGNALALGPEPDGSNVALVTGQAGPGIAIADRLKNAGVSFPNLSSRTRRVVDDVLPGLTYASNPIDTGQPPEKASYENLLTTVAEDPNVDILLVYQLYEARVDYPIEILGRIIRKEDMPVIFATNGPSPAVDEELPQFQSAGVAAYRSPERAADVVKSLCAYAETNNRMPSDQETMLQ
jgi:acetyltransferase